MTRSGALALLLVAFLLAGCGVTASAKAPPPQTLSHGRFVYLVRQATRRMVCGTPHGKPTTFQQARAQLRSFLNAYERWLFSLRGLAPPASDAIVFHRLLGDMDRLDILLHGIV